MASPIDTREIASSTRGACGQVVLRPAKACTGVKVFTATRFVEREALGEQVTEWLQCHPRHTPTEIIVTQSSDAAFHCLTITVFYQESLS
jgi:hypothetical protein